MPNFFPIQQSFSFGEISPLLTAQVESDLYKGGLQHLLNMLPNSHGPSVRRNGFRFISLVNEDQIPLKMIPFNASLDRDYVVVIGDDFLQVYDSAGPAFGGLGAQDLIFNGTFNSGLQGWSFDAEDPLSTMTWNSVTHRMVLTTRDNPSAVSIGGFQSITLNTTTGVQHNIIFDLIELIPGTRTYELRIGTTVQAFDILQQVVTSGLRQSIPFTPAAAVTTVFVEFRVITPGSNIELDNVSVVEDGAPSSLLQFASPWKGFPGIEFMQWAMSPGGNPALYITHPDVVPQALVLTVATNIWDLFPVPFVNTPSQWGANNWPRAVTFFAQRSFWGGIRTDPEKFWASKVGDYIDMDPGTSQADEGLEYEIARRGDILFMSGAKELIIGTENSEYIIATESGVVKPGDVEVKQQSAYGSFLGIYEQSGDRILYISATGSKLRTMAYEWTKDAWTSIDMAWPSEHLLRNVVVQMAYQFDPGQSIWMITSDRQLISCSYDREQGIIGWAQHGRDELPITGGDVTGLPDVPFDFLVWAGLAVTTIFGVNRLWTTLAYIDGEGTPKIALMLSDAASTMDVFIEHGVSVDTDVVTGLGHLEGMDVNVLVNGAVDPPNVVVGGQITTQREGTFFQVGRSNTAYMKTLPKEGGSREGTSQGAMKRDPYIYARVLRSTVPFINGKRPPDRTPSTPMDTREPLKSEDIRVSDLGWDRTAQIEIWENLPLPLTIIGLFTKNTGHQR